MYNTISNSIIKYVLLFFALKPYQNQYIQLTGHKHVVLFYKAIYEMIGWVGEGKYSSHTHFTKDKIASHSVLYCEKTKIQWMKITLHMNLVHMNTTARNCQVNGPEFLILFMCKEKNALKVLSGVWSIWKYIKISKRDKKRESFYHWCQNSKISKDYVAPSTKKVTWNGPWLMPAQKGLRQTDSQRRTNTLTNGQHPSLSAHIHTQTLLYSPSGSFLTLHFSLRVSRSPNRLSRIAFAMGSIMAVVAVLLNHMDKKEDVIIMPKINLEKSIFFFFSNLDGHTATQQHRQEIADTINY